jgi:hypothetical protein
MDQQQIDLVEAEPLQALLMRAADIRPAQIARRDLGGEEDLAARQAAVANRPADLGLVAINLGGIKVTVTKFEHHTDGLIGGISR